MPSEAAPKAASRARRRDAFQFAEARVRAGSSAVVELPVARVPAGTWSKLPLIVVHGSRDGPTLWLDGAIHGDEINGTEIVRRLVATIDATELAGTILAVPVVNVFGVTLGSRYLPDGRDLNRSFPGSPRGSLAAQLAHLFFERIARRCQLGLDFHTGSGGRCNLPHLRFDLDDHEARRLADAFAPPLQLHASVRDGSLRAAARRHGIPVLIYEAGEAMRFCEQGIQLGVDGALRVLRALGMIAHAPPPPADPPLLARSSKWCRANRSGFCRIEVALGQTVATGEQLATIVGATGRSPKTVRARRSGLVFGLLRTGLVHRGDALVHIADPAR